MKNSQARTRLDTNERGAVECTELLQYESNLLVSASPSSQESLRRLPCVPVLVPVAPHDLIANRNAGLSNMPTGICGASSSTTPLAPSRPHSRKTCVSTRGRVVVPENPQLRICSVAQEVRYCGLVPIWASSMS